MSFIDIVFDGPPSHESGRFVEVEDETGRSIRYGHWIHRPDGFWALRFLKDEKANRPHCHVAGTMTGKHIDECSLCGMDIRDEIHAGSGWLT